MAFTKVVGAGIHTLSNIVSHNINSSGIITATKFVGPFDGSNGDFSGDVTIDGNLVVNGTTTTLDTNLIDVDKIEVTTTLTNVAVAVTHNGTGDLIRLYDGSTQVVTVDDEGNVGIGTNTLFTGGAHSGTHQLTITNNSPSMSLGRSNTDQLYVRREQVNGRYTFQTNQSGGNNGVISLQPYGGNVGIGSASPANKLDVALGTAWIYPDEDGTEAIALKLGKLADYNSSFNDILVADNDGSSSPTYRVTSKINRYVASWYFDRTTSPGATRINAFQLNSSKDGPNLGNRFIIRDLHNTADSIKLWSNGDSFIGVTTDGSSRNFGIGTNNPAYPLEVVGDGGGSFSASSNSTNGVLSVVGKNSSGQVSAISRIKSYPDTSSNQSHMAFETRNSSSQMVEAIRIDSTQKVGIGTDNPTSHLQVYRKTQFASNPIIQARSNNGSINELKFEIDGDGDAYFNGNVGIGSAIPAAKLDVGGNITAAGDLTVSHTGLAVNIFESTNNHSRLRIKSGSSSNSQLEFADQDDADAGEIRYDHGNDRMTFHVGNNVEKLRITGDGKVAIGNFNPSVSGLSISNSSTNRGFEFDTGSGFDSTSCIRAYDRPTTAYKSLGLTGSDIRFGINDVEKARIDSSGRLRVASTTESADTAFDDVIVGNYSGNRGISILSGASSQGALGFAKNGTMADGYVAYNHNSTATDSSMVIKSSGKIQFNPGSSQKFTITSVGNVRHTGGGDGRMYTFSTDDSAHYMKFDNTLNGIILNGYGGIAFETNGTNERLRITSGGDVGIGGLTDVEKKVDIHTGDGGSVVIRPNGNGSGTRGNANVVNNLLILRMPYGQNAGSSSNAGARIGLQFTGRNDSAGYGDNPGKSASVYGVSEDSSAGYTRKMGLAFYTSAHDAAQTEKMRITADGDVNATTGHLQARDIKIGLVNNRYPIIQRAVQSSGSQNLTITGGSGYSENTASDHSLVDARQGAMIQLGAGNPTSDTYGGYIKYFAHGHTSPNNPGYGNSHIFFTRSAANTNTERLRITADGYLQQHKLIAVSYSDSRGISLSSADLTTSNFYNHTNFASDSTILDSDGHFVAPIHGIYRLYFRCTTDGSSGNRANVRLRKNGNVINEAYAGANDSGDYMSVSSEIVMELNAGEYFDIQVGQLHTLTGTQHKQVTFHMLG